MLFGLFGSGNLEHKALICVEFHTPFLFPATESVKVPLEFVGVGVTADGSVYNTVISEKSNSRGDLVGQVVDIN